jgi:GntR family phosphonate transport system transcriptional regulator
MNDVLTATETCLDKSSKHAELDGALTDERSVGDKPIYLQVAYQLEHEIKRLLKPGDMLDSEMNLAKRFQVNRHTVRRSIEQLVRAGIVVKQQGKGTQVVSNQIEYLLNPTGKFTKNLNELGKTANASRVSQQLMAFVDAPIKVQRYFNAEAHATEQIVELITLRFIENVPVCLIHHYLSLKHLPNVHETYEQGSLHQHISEQYAVSLERAQINISATLANASEALQLKCAVDSPLVELQSVNRIRDSHEVVEVSISHSRPDRLQYQIDFKGN